jgi:type I restriction enzyme, S subunit
MNSKGKSSAETGDGTALVPKLRFPEFEEADGWKEIPLQKLARPITDRATTGDADNVLSLSGEHGLVLQSEYFGKKIAGDSTDRYLKIRKDDFVYNDRTTKASSFGTIKRLSAHEGGIVSPIYKCFRFQSSENPAFWEWYFESGSHDAALGGLVNEGARAGRFNISVTQFLSTNAWRPDEDEQQKIADCLDSADALIEAQGRKVEALKAHKKGLMQQLFPQEGETEPRLRFPEFEGAGEWEERHLESLAKRGSGHTPSKSKPEYYDGGIKWISLADSKRLDNGLISETEVEVSAEGINNSSAVLHKAGSVLISRDAGIGKSAVMALPMAVSQHFIVWTCDDRKLNNWFLYHLLQQSKPLFDRAATGSTIKTIGLQFFIDLRFRIPSRPEQQRIADCLNSLDDLIGAETRKLDTLKTHKKGLMQQLFPRAAEVDA